MGWDDDDDRSEPINGLQANLIISQAAACSPDRLHDAIRKVARSFEESGRYSADQIKAAIIQILKENNQEQEPRH